MHTSAAARRFYRDADIARVGGDLVGSRAAVGQVAACAVLGAEAVVPRATEHAVDADAADQVIIAATPVDEVRARSTTQRVCATVSAQDIVAWSTGQRVRTVGPDPHNAGD